MNTVFLDTVGLIALWDTDDQWHALAQDTFERILADRSPVISTTYILLECGNTAARRSFRGTTSKLRRTLELRGELITPTVDDWRSAWADYERSRSGQAGIVDCVSFTVMRRLNIKRAFTNDRHFQAAGFEVMF